MDENVKQSPKHLRDNFYNILSKQTSNQFKLNAIFTPDGNLFREGITYIMNTSIRADFAVTGWFKLKEWILICLLNAI